MTREQLESIRARVEAALTYEQSEYVPEEGMYVSPATEGGDTVEWMTCPLCDGDGEVEGQRYDAKETVAATVVAYGIGEGLHRAEDWVENAPADMRALLAEVERLTAERDAAFKRGVKAMREAAATYLDQRLTERKATAIWVGPDELRALPDPEDILAEGKS